MHAKSNSYAYGSVSQDPTDESEQPVQQQPPSANNLHVKSHSCDDVPLIKHQKSPFNSGNGSDDWDEHDVGFTFRLLANIRHVTSNSFVVTNEDVQLHKFTGTATIPSHVANMTKNLIGGGVLSLSGGIAIYASTPWASISAFVWVVILGAVLGYFCLLIGKCCQMTGTAAYRDCWEQTVGEKGGLIVAVVNTIDPLLGIFANASILGQSLMLLLMSVDIYWSQVECLLVITVVAILPLCLMKNLNALAPFSAFGMVAVLAVLGAMIVRYLDGSYEPDGEFYDDIPKYLKPSFGKRNNPWSIQVLPFVCMVYTSFDMHYNSPHFYAELKDASVARYAQTVSYSFAVTAFVYFAIAIVGFLTFGQHCDSYILNNYSDRDPLATFSRLAIGVCSLGSYPLNFIGVRDNCLDILGMTEKVDTAVKLNCFTLALLAILTVTSCFITDLGLINAVGGGTTVTLVCFIFPAIMYHYGLRKYGRGSRQEKEEWWFMTILTVIGVVLGIVGVWVSVLEA